MVLRWTKSWWFSLCNQDNACDSLAFNAINLDSTSHFEQITVFCQMGTSCSNLEYITDNSYINQLELICDDDYSCNSTLIYYVQTDLIKNIISEYFCT